MWTAFLPSIDTASAKLHSLVSVKSSCYHVEETLLNGEEDLMSIVNGADADVGACWLLHMRGGGVWVWKAVWDIHTPATLVC